MMKDVSCVSNPITKEEENKTEICKYESGAVRVFCASLYCMTSPKKRGLHRKHPYETLAMMINMNLVLG